MYAYINFSRTICNKATSKAPFSVKRNVQLLFFSNVLHNNQKAFNQKWHINKTALAMDIQVILRQVFFHSKMSLPLQIKFYIKKKQYFTVQ